MRAVAALIVATLGSDACLAASMERRIWDAMHMGRAEPATAGEIARAAAGSDRQTLRFLAVAARASTDPGAAHVEALKQAFRAALDPAHPISPPAVRDDFPAGFDRERLLMALAGALVDVGAIDFALDQLDNALKSADKGDTPLLLQVIRIVGGSRAKAILARPHAIPGGDWYPPRLAEIRYFPDWEDLKRWSPLIPPGERTRRRLEEEAVAGCDVKPAVAAYYLAHVPAGSPQDEAGTDDVLLRVARRTERDCFWARLLAARALALRSIQPPVLWESLVSTDADTAYYSAAIARFGFAQHGNGFAPVALSLLGKSPNWYVQSEISANLTRLLDGERLRDYWDIWQPRLGGGGEVRAKVVPLAARPIVEWLAQSSSALEPDTRNLLLAYSAKEASGDTFALWLRLAAARQQKESSWWIFQSVGEPAALPALRYWKRGKSSGEELNSIRRFENDVAWLMGKRYAACCEETRACLERRVTHSAAQRIAGRSIANDAELAQWLSGRPWVEALPQPTDLDVRFVDRTQRLADVRGGNLASQRWQHLYGCWVPLDGTPR